MIIYEMKVVTAMVINSNNINKTNNHLSLILTVYQFLAYGRWFSPDTPASSTTKTGRHDIAEILLKVALNTKIKSDLNWAYWTQTKTTTYNVGN